MSASKFQQLSDAFLKISQGFAEVATLMQDNLEPVELRSEVFAVATSEDTTDNTDNSNSNVVVEEEASVQPPAKKMKKERDPNLPKKPLNSYFLFQRDYRPQLKENHPNATFDEFKEIMNATWKQLPTEKKEYYEKLAKEHYAAHVKEVEEYNRKKASGETIGENSTENISEDITEETTDITTPSTSAVPVALPVVADISMTSSDAESPKKKKKKNKNKEKRESQHE